MFDENQPNQGGMPPANLPTEPVDMFAGVDDAPSPKSLPDALSAGLLKPKSAADAASTATRAPFVSSPAAGPVAGMSVAYKIKEPILGKIILGLTAVVVLAALAYGGYWAYTRWGVEGTDVESSGGELTDIPIAAPAVTEDETSLDAILAKDKVVSATSTTSTLGAADTADLSQVPVDMNNDKILFGEPVDGDKDGLDDIRERELGTNENRADTDGDGLSDGDEVLVFKTDPLNPDTDGDTYPDGKEISFGYNPLGPGKLPAGISTTTAPGTTTKK